jgi:AraC-like DNA-binding protein
MKLYVKNMVCDRCKMVVKAELNKLGFNPISVNLGEIELAENELTGAQLAQIDEALHAVGFARLAAKKEQLVMQLKSAMLALIRDREENLKVNLSAYLSEQFKQHYANLSLVFSETTNTTIEKYFIEQKIERVKELIAYGELSLSEIAYQLNYSSVAHLSAQFRKVTGITPSAYKIGQIKIRKTLDQL